MRRFLAVALSALTITALGAGPARAAATAEVEVFWTLLVARGAAVDVSYGVTCPAGFTGTTTVTITQVRDDGLLAGGTTAEELTCDGTGFLEMSRVTASVLGAPFERGRASLSMLLSGCDAQACFSAPINQNTRLQN